jgi:hypothetical protein
MVKAKKRTIEKDKVFTELRLRAMHASFHRGAFRPISASLSAPALLHLRARLKIMLKTRKIQWEKANIPTKKRKRRTE